MIKAISITRFLFADKPVEGVQAYVDAPLAVKATAVPGLQYVAELGVTATVGLALTFTVNSGVDADNPPFAHVKVTT